MAKFPINILNKNSYRWIPIIFILLSLCFITVRNIHAAECIEGWDATLLSQLKTSYQPRETINATIEYKVNVPPSCPHCIQQIMIGFVDQNGRISGYACIYDGPAVMCPNWTSGTKELVMAAPETPGTYKIIVANDYGNSCQQSQPYFPYKSKKYKELATIAVAAVPQPPAPLGQPEIEPPPLHINLFDNEVPKIQDSIAQIKQTIDSIIHQTWHIIKTVVFPLLILILILIFVWRFRKALDKFWHWLEDFFNPPGPDGMSFEEFKKWLISMDWREFEQFVKKLLEKLGFKAMVTQPTKDGGVDVIAEKIDELGMKSKYMVQCRRYANGRVGVEAIRQLNGVLHTDVPPSKGIVACTGGFTKDAIDFAQRCGIALWDIDYLYKLYTKNLVNRN
jgi:hypothetical protein